MGLGALIAILVLPYWTPAVTAFVRKHPVEPSYALAERASDGQTDPTV
jgi:hypothetical protein